MKIMSRYIKKFGRIGFALGPSEERGFAMWAGYEIEGVSDDLSDLGLIRVDDWTEQQLADRGVTTFTKVSAEDRELRTKLGIAKS